MSSSADGCSTPWRRRAKPRSRFLHLGKLESYLQEFFFFFFLIFGSPRGAISKPRQAPTLRRGLSTPRRTKYVFLQIFSPCSSLAVISINSSFA